MNESINIKEIISHGALIIDVRTPEEYKDGHISGSINIPLDDLPSATSWLIKDVPTVVVCASGSRSSIAKDFLESNGYEKVYNGGSWNSLGDIKVGACPTN